MVSVPGLLATLDPGNQEKGNPGPLVKTSLNAEVAEERRFGSKGDFGPTGHQRVSPGQRPG
jgi:hypothetical protein